jgi:hypothetical protein
MGTVVFHRGRGRAGAAAPAKKTSGAGRAIAPPRRFAQGQGLPDAVWRSFRSLGGTRLGPDEVRRIVLTCCDMLARDCEDATRYDNFPSVAEALAAAAPGLAEAELGLLEEVIAQHELGSVPDSHAAFLLWLASTHRPAWRRTCGRSRGRGWPSSSGPAEAGCSARWCSPPTTGA